MTSVEVVRGAVKVPHVFRGLSGRCVLTQEWVVGRKRRRSRDDPPRAAPRQAGADAAQQLHGAVFGDWFPPRGSPPVELHADGGRSAVHPRLRDDDHHQRQDQRVAFIEYIAHLSARDYDKTLGDLVNLGYDRSSGARGRSRQPRRRRPVLAETLETLYSGSGGSAAPRKSISSTSRATRAWRNCRISSKPCRRIIPSVCPEVVLILRAFDDLERSRSEHG